MESREKAIAMEKAREGVSRPETTRVRLAIAIPVLMVLLPLILGVIHYRFIDVILAVVRSDDPLRDELALVLFRVYLSSFAVCAVALVFGLGISWAISKPIRQLIRTTREIAAGDLSHMVPTDSGDEFSDLGNSFNEMIMSLNRLVTERNRYILECYTGGLILVDAKGQILASNTAAEQILNESSDSLISHSIHEVLSRHKGSERFAAIVERAVVGRHFVSSKEIAIQRRDGEDFPLVVTTSPLRDVGGGQRGTVINFRDLSEIKAFHRQMSRADRLAAVGTLAAGVAHEIRNPLASIKGLAQLLGEDAQTDSQTRHYADVIVREVDRLNGVVRELLNFAQGDQQETRLWNVNQVLREALEVARWKATQEREAEVTVRENYGEVPVFPLHAERINRAFLNLLLNAFEACPNKGVVSVSSRYEAENGISGAIVVSIENTGEPIPHDNVEKIFEPFFSTKSSGTGLGLPIAYQIITSHGGTVDVESSNGKTVFSVRFPVTVGGATLDRRS